MMFRSPTGQRTNARFDLAWRSEDDSPVRIVPFDFDRHVAVPSMAIEAEEVGPPMNWPTNAIRIECPSEGGNYAVLLHLLATGDTPRTIAWANSDTADAAIPA